ncbi:MAG: hypothetical protein KGY56_06790 [Desulfobacterales bacterium]|nr:hypothetical protein [Desulfobacterales bacterium]
MAAGGNFGSTKGMRMIYKPAGNDFPDPDFDKEEKQLVCAFCNRYYRQEKIGRMVLLEFAAVTAFLDYQPGCGGENVEKGSHVRV